MPEWLPFISTLCGAIVGGGISFLAQWMSARSARQNQQTQLAEQRLIWATERELAQLQGFHTELAGAIDAVVAFRVFEARKAYEVPQLDGGLDGNELRSLFEEALYKMRIRSLFCDGEVEQKLAETLKSREEWMLAPDYKTGVTHLMALEEGLFSLQNLVGARYRLLLTMRRDGTDARAEYEHKK